MSIAERVFTNDPVCSTSSLDENDEEEELLPVADDDTVPGVVAEVGADGPTRSYALVSIDSRVTVELTEHDVLEAFRRWVPVAFTGSAKRRSMLTKSVPDLRKPIAEPSVFVSMRSALELCVVPYGEYPWSLTWQRAFEDNRPRRPLRLSRLTTVSSQEKDKIPCSL